MTSLYQSVGAVDTIEWACELCGHCIQNDWVSRAMNLYQILLSSVETIWMIQKAVAMGNWWWAASSRQNTCITSPAEFFGETSNHPGDSAPYSPDLMPCDFWLFSKLKSPSKGKIWDCRCDSGKYDRAADGDWQKCVTYQGAYFEGDWGIIVLRTMFLVSCIFLNKCLHFS